MYRHRLAAVFDPRSLLLISDRHVAVFDNIPAPLHEHCCWLRLDQGELSGFRMPQADRFDLCVVAVGQDQYQKVLDFLSAHTPRALILLAEEQIVEDPLVVSAHFQEWIRRHDCLAFGPRAFGMQRPRKGLNLSRQRLAAPGKVAIVSSSRTIQMACMDWTYSSGVGLSAAISLGEADGVTLSDILEFLAGDPQTESIVLFMEKLEPGRSFLSALRTAASIKPVIILRAGRHNPEFSGSDAVFDAAVRRAGAIRVRWFIQLFAVLKALTHSRQPRGSGLALVGTSPSVTQLLRDAVSPRSATVQLARISEPTRAALETVLGPGSRGDNPIVTYSPLLPEKFISGLQLLLQEKSVDAIMVIIAPDNSEHLPDLVRRLAEEVPKARKPVLVTFFGEDTMSPLRQILDEAGTPAYRTPETAFAGLHALMSYHYNQRLLQQIRIPLLSPPSRDLRSIQDIIAQARREQRLALRFDEGMAILQAYGIKAHFYCELPATAQQVSAYMPWIRIGVARDEIFGPWLYFTESDSQYLASGDKGLELPPLNAYLASELIHRSRLWRQELRDRISEAVFEQLRNTLEFVSELIIDVPDIEDLVIDPIIPAADSLQIQDIRITLSQTIPDPAQSRDYPHMAIYPYPSYLIQQYVFADQRRWTVRPIRPEDAQALQEFIRGLSGHSRYMRFVSMMTELTPKMLVRYSYVDYCRELALVATTGEESDPASEKIIGMAHYLRNSDGVGAEYALVVADEWQGKGLGKRLMEQLLQEAANQGLHYIEGFILSQNRRMLQLMKSLGLRDDPWPEDPAMRRVWKPLGAPAARTP